MTTTRRGRTVVATGVPGLALAVLLAGLTGCGSPGGAPSPDADPPGQETEQPGTGNGEATGEETGEETEASVTTTLDLGQPFAEDPSADAELDSFTVAITSTRVDLAAIPVTIRVTNRTGQPRRVLGLDVQASWLPSTADPLDPDPANTLVASIEAGTGSCTTVTSTAAAFAGTCTVGRLEPQQHADIGLVVTSTYNLEIGIDIRSEPG